MSTAPVIPPGLVEYQDTFGDWTLTLGYELWENQYSQDALHGENVALGITLSYDDACRWRDSAGWNRGFRTLNVLSHRGSSTILTIGMARATVAVKAKTRVTTTTTLTVE